MWRPLLTSWTNVSYCNEQTAVKHENGGLVAVSLRCRAWTCPECSDQRKRQLIAEAIGGQPNKFLTLTMKPTPGITPDAQALKLSRAWRLLRLRMQRRNPGEKFPFIAVIEKHKSGWPHLHILFRGGFIPWKWYRFHWLQITGSKILRIEHLVQSRKAAVYCSKYCSKATQKYQTAKRYWQSRDYDLRPEPEEKPKPEPGFGWEIYFKSFDKYIKDHIELGHTVVSQSTRSAFIWVDTS